MKNLIIKITAIDAGDDSLPCHLFPTETCDAVSFNTSPGLDTDTVRAVIYSLFEDACNVDYSPVDGSGRLPPLIPPRPQPWNLYIFTEITFHAVIIFADFILLFSIVC